MSFNNTSSIGATLRSTAAEEPTALFGRTVRISRQLHLDQHRGKLCICAQAVKVCVLLGPSGERRKHGAAVRGGDSSVSMVAGSLHCASRRKRTESRNDKRFTVFMLLLRSCVSRRGTLPNLVGESFHPVSLDFASCLNARVDCNYHADPAVSWHGRAAPQRPF